MNRAERRRLQKQGNAKEPVMNINRNDLMRIKKSATNAALDVAFELMLGIPVMVIHDKFDQLSNAESNGKSREERFVEMCLDLYDSFDRGYLSLDDIRECLWAESGVKIERSK